MDIHELPFTTIRIEPGASCERDRGIKDGPRQFTRDAICEFNSRLSAIVAARGNDITMLICLSINAVGNERNVIALRAD